MRAFAEAAGRFYQARPWQHLANEDLIVVDAPRAPKGMAHISVLGNGGQQFGFACFESRAAFERVLEMTDARHMRRAFGVTFGPVEDLPFDDVDLWEEHALPVAGPVAYPMAADIGRDAIRRPSARELTHMEALLRALADTTEADLDQARWDRQVETFDGPVTMSLSLPLLLEAEADDSPRASRGRRSGFVPNLAERGSVEIARFLEQREFASLDEINAALEEARQSGLFDQGAEEAAGRPLTPLEQAQELAYDAQEAEGRLRIKLARKALATSPDCADAYVVLGECAATPEAALDWYRQGIEAGERAIGSAFASLAGEFWGHLETRPYMRARLALAQTLYDLERLDEAIDHYRELLRLNPNDNQGARYLLLPALLEQGRDEDAEVLLGEYDGDIQAIWCFGAALWRFRSEGDGALARSELTSAVRRNPRVIDYLLDPDSMAGVMAPHFTLGSKEEAAYAAEELYDAFEKTIGAFDWLRAQEPRLRTRSKRKGKKKR